ncbi:ABC1-domain-containing protein [Auriscalpium vulgare]|uniref:ABC1-domain-containing protein n=1 Tax=Auriscalpium vulgare TaxID=40419 RepID=A0ACB8RDK1_9AGAM|nr:ABC1-domain-containing protein [Auriscalpium vulgare]
MPPGSLYNWLTVAHSALEVLEHAALHRSAQLPRPGFVGLGQKQRRTAEDEPTPSAAAGASPEPAQKSPPVIPPDSLSRTKTIRMEQVSDMPVVLRDQVPISLTHDSKPSASLPQSPHTLVAELASADARKLVAASDPVLALPFATSTSSLVQSDEIIPDILVSPPTTSRHLQSSKVPSSRIGRLFHYGGLAASLGYGAASELLRRSTSSSDPSSQGSSLMMTEANLTRLVNKLTQMRGAALKLGQFLSIQDTHVLPPELERVFRRVQDSAHYMPNWQMEEVMISSLGPSWRDSFAEFTPVPFAAASIGQVHHAVLAACASPCGKEAPVAVKIQFPNIHQSVESDLGYLKALLTAGRLLPRGLFLEKTLAVMKEELADECDYTREASFLRTFGDATHLGGDARFKVPWVWTGSTNRVLVMERVDGVSVGEDVIKSLSQDDRDDIATRIVELCLKELFVFRKMQTDPNWTNFLWNVSTRQIELVDFGATRAYSHEFIDNWLRLLQAAASSDREACREWSLKLGYLTGEESELMLEAHITSMQLLAAPFRPGTPQPFAFGPGSSWAQITADIRAQIPVMLQHRLTPPPQETYSLNRKLSGAFLLASRLDARVDCKDVWDKIVAKYEFST